LNALPTMMLAFYEKIFLDLDNQSPSERSANKLNANYVNKRSLSEGLKFISNTLPELGKAIEVSLITGKQVIVNQTFARRWRTKLPNFMYNYMKILFSADGHPLAPLNPEKEREQAYAYYCIRQVCLAFSKAEDVGCKVDDTAALQQFVERITEQSVITAPSWLLNSARRILKDLFYDEEGRLSPMLAQWVDQPYGRHGPGAVAEKETGLQKWDFNKIPGMDPQLYQLQDRSKVKQPYSSSNTALPESRAICVPKDFRSPRIICIEPKEFQFAQQGLWRVLSALVQHDIFARKAISFKNQEYNATLSRDSAYATIDLKDASDRVSMRLCRLLLSKEVFALTTRYRSRKIRVNGQVITPTCFASMGSAVCFPMETLVFWAIAQAARDPRDRHLSTRVFGDDIIVPRGSAYMVIKALESCALKVNTGKTCVNTPIRESCGAYWFGKTDVRIVRFKHSSVESYPAWKATLDSCRWLNEALLAKTSYAMLLCLKDLWHVPFGHFGLPKSSDGFSCQSRWNQNLQRHEYRLPGYRVSREVGEFPTWAGLYAWLVGNSITAYAPADRKVEMHWTNDIT